MKKRNAVGMGAWRWALVGTAVLLGCGGATDEFGSAPDGTESGPCYPNGSCNAGLTCVANVCVSQDAAAIDGSTGADSAAVDDTTGSDAAIDDSTPADSSVSSDTMADSIATPIDADATAIDTEVPLDSVATDSLMADSATPMDTAVGDVPADTSTDAAVDAATDSADGGPLPPYLKTTLLANCDNLASGTDVPAALADNAASAIAALPFSFKHFGNTVGFYSVTSNGFIQLWPSTSGAPSTSALNEAIPSSASPNNVVAPFWDDLVVVFSNLKVGTFGSAPNRRFVVQWGHWGANGNPNVRLTFQAKLFETSNVIEFHYCAMEATAAPDIARATGGSATIGLENAGGTAGTQHSFNTPASVQTGVLLRFTPQ